MVSIPSTPDRAKPTIYDLATDWARFGITHAQAEEVLNNFFYDRRYGSQVGSPEFIVLHIQDGTTKGSLQHWASVEASSTVMVQKDGSILRVIPEEHGPWTNGDVNKPTKEAIELVAMGGNANNWCFTLEAEGGPWDSMPKAQQDAIVWQVETWIIAEPEILDHIYSILRHGWINSVSRPNCPGNYFDPVMVEINKWLGTGMEAEVPPVEEESNLPQGLSEELLARLFNPFKVKNPDNGKVAEFDWNGKVSNAWYDQAIASIPTGAPWYKGNFCPMTQCIRRGSESGGRKVWQFSNFITEK